MSLRCVGRRCPDPRLPLGLRAEVAGAGLLARSVAALLARAAAAREAALRSGLARLRARAAAAGQLARRAFLAGLRASAAAARRVAGLARAARLLATAAGAGLGARCGGDRATDVDARRLHLRVGLGHRSRALRHRSRALGRCLRALRLRDRYVAFSRGTGCLRTGGCSLGTRRGGFGTCRRTRCSRLSCSLCFRTCSRCLLTGSGSLLTGCCCLLTGLLRGSRRILLLLATKRETRDDNRYHDDEEFPHARIIALLGDVAQLLELALARVRGRTLRRDLEILLVQLDRFAALALF